MLKYGGSNFCRLFKSNNSYKSYISKGEKFSMTFDLGDGRSSQTLILLNLNFNEQCFEWNGMNWVGTAPTNPVWSECGYD